MSDGFKNINSNQPDDMKDYFSLSEEPLPEADLLPEVETEMRSNFEHTTPPSTAVDDFDYLLGEDGFSLEDIAQGKMDEEKPVYRKKSKKDKKKKKKVSRGVVAGIWVVLICVISVVLATLILLFAFEYLGVHFGEENEMTIELSQGMTTAQIAEVLEEQEVISNATMFRIYCKIAGYDGTFSYGVHILSNELGYKDIARKLQTPGAEAKTVRVTIPEQASIDDIIAILQENGVCTEKDFQNAVINGTYNFDFVEEIPISEVHYKFEGYLFPDTYDFYCYDSKKCAELAIRKMLKNLDSKLTPEVREKIKKSGYTIHEVLTMASIVELEASSSTADMPKVAAVFYNRLESPSWIGPRSLQSDPTMKYPYGDGRYNTYKIEGLPPGPLCSASESAILAAVSPTENFTATYFVTDSDMKFYFNNSLSAHEKTIANLKRQGKWYVDPELN